MKVFYPLLYERTVWHLSRANSDHIKNPINLFDWESSLNNLDDNELDSVFIETITNIMRLTLFPINRLIVTIEILPG